MIKLYDTKPCADYVGLVQAEGIIDNEYFAEIDWTATLQDLEFKVLAVGNPRVLICKREDCMLFFNSDSSFTISRVSDEKKLFQIIQEIENHIKEAFKL